MTLMMMIGHSIRSFKVSSGGDKQQATRTEKVARGITVTGFVQDNRLLFQGAEHRRKLMWKIEFWLRAVTFPRDEGGIISFGADRVIRKRVHCSFTAL